MAAHGLSVAVMGPLQICIGNPQVLFTSFLELVLTSNAQFGGLPTQIIK